MCLIFNHCFKVSSNKKLKIKSIQENKKVENTSEQKENEEKKEENTQQQQNKNLDYYDEHGKLRYEDIINYENEIRKEIEETTPLISDLKSTSDKKNLKIQNIAFPIDINNNRELLIKYL